MPIFTSFLEQKLYWSSMFDMLICIQFSLLICPSGSKVLHQKCCGILRETWEWTLCPDWLLGHLMFHHLHKLIQGTFLLEIWSLIHIHSWGALTGGIATTKSSRSTMLFTRKMMRNLARMKKQFINAMLRPPTYDSQFLAMKIHSFLPLPQTSGGRWQCLVQTCWPSLCAWCEPVGRWVRGGRTGQPG